MATSLNTTSVVFNDSTVQLTAAFMIANNSIFEHNTTITANATMGTNRNGLSVGPITVSDGAVVTIPDGSTWLVF